MIKRIQSWLLDFIYIQLFVTLISLPILIAWGLPFSLFSPLGNLIFAPFLTIFLLLSSLIFFGSLCNISITWLATLLDWVTHAWLYCMDFAPHSSFLGFARPHWLILFLLPIATLVIVHHRFTRSRMHSIYCFTLLFMLLHISTSWHKPASIIKIPYNNGDITVLHHDNKTVIIDPGLIGQRPSGKQWAQYELIPTITQKTGITHLHAVIILQPTVTALQALEQMCHTTSIDHIMVPVWDGTAPKSMNATWHSLKRTAQSYGTNISRIGYGTKKVPGCESLTVKSLEKRLVSGDYSYKALCVTGTIPDEIISILSCRLQENKKSLK